MQNEQHSTAIRFLSWAVAWFNDHGVECRQVMSESLPVTQLCQGLQSACLKHIRNKPYTPRTNGKAERFIQTLCREWAYAMAFQNSEERDNWCRVTCRSITGSGSTQPWTADHLSSGSTS